MTGGLKIYNTLTNKKEEFKPIDPEHITMYVCGPTVYDFAHVGNARPVVVFDTLARLLRHDFGKLTYARNITDIDDKIIEAALKNFPYKGRLANKDLKEITEKFTAIYETDMNALNALVPDYVPKATKSIRAMISLISDLINKKHAYVSKGHVLFSVPSMNDYGQLSKNKVENLSVGERIQIEEYKRCPADFVLWKPSSYKQPGWKSPWGRGRPGWHTECSAMIEKKFGKTIDIHGGGQDLIFPHHENEIAQSKCAHGGANLANYWMHNGYLTVDGEKMSKSLGNYVTVHELLVKHGKNIGEAIRMCLLTAHYRQPVDFSSDGILQANKHIGKWYRLTHGVKPTVPAPEVLDALRNDLNTPKAIMELHQLAKDENRMGELLASAQLLGLLYRQFDSELTVGVLQANNEIMALVSEREEEKKKGSLANSKEQKIKHYERADEIRNKLIQHGITIKDTPDGPILESD